MSAEKDAWLQTASGKRAYPLDLQPDQIAIEDIAHALSMLCRFNGHCPTFYSVAEHSVHVAHRAVKLAEDPSVFKQALLHDASEAYLVDVPRPLKLTEAFASYRTIELTVQRRIYKRFDLPEDMHPTIRAADADLLWYEAGVFFGADARSQWPNVPEGKLKSLHEPLGLAPKKAYERFLEAFHKGR